MRTPLLKILHCLNHYKKIYENSKEEDNDDDNNNNNNEIENGYYHDYKKNNKKNVLTLPENQKNQNLSFQIITATSSLSSPVPTMNDPVAVVTLTYRRNSSSSPSDSCHLSSNNCNNYNLQRLNYD